MRHVFYAAMVLIGAENSVLGADPAPRISVEVSASRDVKFASVAAVLSAIGGNLGDKANVTLSAQATEGIAAKVRVSSDTPYRRLSAGSPETTRSRCFPSTRSTRCST